MKFISLIRCLSALALGPVLAFSSHATLVTVTPTLVTQTPINIYVKKDTQPLQMLGWPANSAVNSCLDLRLIPANNFLSQVQACNLDGGRTTSFQFRSVTSQAGYLAGLTSTASAPGTAPTRFKWSFPAVGSTYHVTLHLSEEWLVGGANCHLKMSSSDGEDDNFEWQADANSGNNGPFPLTVTPIAGRDVMVELYSDVSGVTGSCGGGVRVHADIAMVPHSVSGSMGRYGQVSISDGSNVTTITSGPKGAYTFPNLLPGTYRIHAHEFWPGEWCADRNVTVNEFDLININLALVYCPNPDS